VDDGLILETTFLVDLERELASGKPGATQAFLEAHATVPLYITFTIAGELAAGVAPERRERWERLIAPFESLPYSADVSWEYGQAFRFLKTNGLLIGANDLWIAATALAHRKTIVTRNLREFQRVPGLSVLSYAQA
jgi:tRNA(fMet)-specific endonuclease VapC